MDVAIIDWKKIDSRFVKDELYEYINAPQWIDFSAHYDPVVDEVWFCRPSCNHPKTVEDFFKEKERAPPLKSNKLLRSASVSDIPPLGDPNNRDATLTRRGIIQPCKVLEESENQNPNFSTPSKHKNKIKKEASKSSTEKKQPLLRKEQTPRLKSTLSARNLFSGGDILNKVTELCNEFKKLASRARDREKTENVHGILEEKQEAKDYLGENTGDLDDSEKEKKPLLESSKEKSEGVETSNSKEKHRRKKRNDDAENTPISSDVKNIKCQEAEGLLQIRTCPPTPQCFSASRGPLKATSPKAFRTRYQDRGILQELKQINREERRVEREENSNNHGIEVTEKEARTLDLFWFLKPCSLSS